MPKEILRIGMAPFRGDEPEYSLSASQKATIARACGCEIPESAWEEILLATQMYLVAVALKDAAMEIPDFLRRSERIRKDLRAFRAKLTDSEPAAVELPKRPYRSEKEAFETAEAILKKLVKQIKIQEFTYGHPIDVMFDILVQCIDSLDLVSSWVSFEVSCPLYRAHSRDSAWEFWIYMLTVTFKSRGLPWRASKHTLKPGHLPSPFVRFVLAMQRTLPRSKRQHSGSEDAISNAIWRVRRGMSFPNDFVDIFRGVTIREGGG